jgi:hypothetical protein
VPSRPFDEYRNTRLWSVLEAALAELSTTREVTVNTGADYVIGYLCQELVARKVAVRDA